MKEYATLSDMELKSICSLGWINNIWVGTPESTHPFYRLKISLFHLNDIIVNKGTRMSLYYIKQISWLDSVQPEKEGNRMRMRFERVSDVTEVKGITNGPGRYREVRKSKEDLCITL